VGGAGGGFKGCAAGGKPNRRTVPSGIVPGEKTLRHVRAGPFVPPASVVLPGPDRTGHVDAGEPFVPGAFFRGREQPPPEAAMLVLVRPRAFVPDGDLGAYHFELTDDRTVEPPLGRARRKAKPQEAGDRVGDRVLPRKEPFSAARGPVLGLGQLERFRQWRGPSARLPAPQAPAVAALLSEAVESLLSKVARPDAGRDQPCGDVSLDALDPDPRRETSLHPSEELRRDGRVVRLVAPRSPVVVERGPGEHQRRVDLEKVRAVIEFVPQPLEVREVGTRVHPGESEHEVVADLEAPVPRLPRRAGHVPRRVRSAYRLKDVVVKALDADLDPRHPRFQ